MINWMAHGKKKITTRQQVIIVLLFGWILTILLSIWNHIKPFLTFSFSASTSILMSLYCSHVNEIIYNNNIPPNNIPPQHKLSAPTLRSKTGKAVEHRLHSLRRLHTFTCTYIMILFVAAIQNTCNPSDTLHIHIYIYIYLIISSHKSFKFLKI